MKEILLLVAVLIAAVLAVLLKKLGILSKTTRGPGGALPYHARNYFFTKAENSFFQVLRQAVGSRYVIFAKVRLSDVLDIDRGVERYQSHRNRIQSKHVDFVLCEPQDFRICAALELDDASHERDDRVSRDHFLKTAFEAAGLPLIRVPVRRGYQPRELAGMILSAVGEKPFSR